MSVSVATGVVFAIRVVISGVLVVSAASKIRQPQRFARDVAAYRVIPDRYALGFAWFVIVTEALLAAGLVSGSVPVFWLLGAGVLFGLFGVAIGLALSRGNVVPCGCFGSEAEEVSKRSLARIGLLLGIVLSGIAIVVSEPALLAWPPGSDVLPAIALAGFGLMVGHLILLSSDVLAAFGVRRFPLTSSPSPVSGERGAGSDNARSERASR